MNLPSINGHVLTGAMTDASLGIKVDVDKALSTTSENPVQNKVITSSINNLNTNMTSVTAKADANAAEIEAIKEELGNMTFIPIDITSFGHKLGAVENGSIISNLELYWECSKVPTSLILNDEAVGLNNPIVLTTDYTTNAEFKLVAGDGKTQDEATTTLDFVDGLYYGVSDTTTYDSTLINSLKQILSTEKAQTLEVTAGLTESIFIAAPAALSYTFSVGGFTGGFHEVATLDYTNKHNYNKL